MRGRTPRIGALYALGMLLALVVAACDGTSSVARPTATLTAHPSPTATTAATQTPTAPNPPAINATIAYLYDPLTGAVYLSRNADQEVAMASTTKIMTALVAITYGNLDAPITIGQDAVDVPAGSSLAFLKQGDKIALRDLLYGLLLPSGDDAAVAIADGVAGSQGNFVALMNVEAVLLGLVHTHYTDVHGLDAPNCDYAHLTGYNANCLYTTATDLAHLAAFAMQSKVFAQIVATPKYSLAATATHGTYVWDTTNELLSTFAYQGAVATGVKTGQENAAGECLVFSAAGPSVDLLGVVLHDGEFDAADPNEYYWRFEDAAVLLKWEIDQQLAAAPAGSSTPTPTSTAP